MLFSNKVHLENIKHQTTMHLIWMHFFENVKIFLHSLKYQIWSNDRWYIYV